MNQAAWQIQAKKVIRFWLQTTAALMLCLWVGYELSLTLVSSAAITVCILSDPNPGAVFSKSKWRFLGTLAGGVVIALLSLWFAQAPWIFLTGLAIWTGICSYVSAHFRYFQAYAAALAGYTATIIFVENHQVFDLVMFSTVQRVGEICLGVLSVALVFGLTHIRGGVRRLEPQMHDQARRTLSLAQSILQTPTQQHVVVQLRKWVQQTEQLQHDLLLLGEEESVFAPQARRIRIALADLYGPLTLFCESLLALAQSPKSAAIQATQTQVLACLMFITQSNNNAQTIQIALQQELPKIHSPLQQAAQEIQNPQQRARVLALSASLASLLQALWVYRQTRHAPQSGPTRSAGRLVENPIAIYQAIGVGVGYLLFCAFWIRSGWPGGELALLMFVANSMLQMANDQPVQGLVAMFYGLCLAVLVTLPLKLLLLPASSGMGWLLFYTALGLLPGCALKANPKTTSVGAGYLMFFTIMSGYNNVMDYNIQDLLTQIVSLIVSIVASIILMAATHPWRAESRLRLMLRQAHRDFSSTRDALQTLQSTSAGSTEQVLQAQQLMGQWEDRQFLRLLQLDHVIMLSHERSKDATARVLIRLTQLLRQTYSPPFTTLHKKSV